MVHLGVVSLEDAAVTCLSPAEPGGALAKVGGNGHSCKWVDSAPFPACCLGCTHTVTSVSRVSWARPPRDVPFLGWKDMQRT